MNTIILSKTDNNATVEATIGQEIVISLKENPVSGYRWSYKNSGTMLLLNDHYYEIHEDTDTDATGVHHFHFEILKPGETNLILSLKREWEKSRDGIELFSIHLLAG